MSEFSRPDRRPFHKSLDKDAAGRTGNEAKSEESSNRASMSLFKKPDGAVSGKVSQPEFGFARPDPVVDQAERAHFGRSDEFGFAQKSIKGPDGLDGLRTFLPLNHQRGIGRWAIGSILMRPDRDRQIVGARIAVIASVLAVLSGAGFWLASQNLSTVSTVGLFVEQDPPSAAGSITPSVRASVPAANPKGMAEAKQPPSAAAPPADEIDIERTVLDAAALPPPTNPSIDPAPGRGNDVAPQSTRNAESDIVTEADIDAPEESTNANLESPAVPATARLPSAIDRQERWETATRRSRQGDVVSRRTSSIMRVKPARPHQPALPKIAATPKGSPPGKEPHMPELKPLDVAASQRWSSPIGALIVRPALKPNDVVLADASVDSGEAQQPSLFARFLAGLGL